MTDRVSEPNTAAEYARLSPAERWQLDQQRNQDGAWTDPSVLFVRDPITGGATIAKRRT